MIKFHCNVCDKKLGVPPEYAGKKVKCPRCTTPITVPQPEVPDAPAPDSIWTDDLLNPTESSDNQNLDCTCAQCNAQMSIDDNACPQCGYTPQPINTDQSHLSETRLSNPTSQSTSDDNIASNLPVIIGVGIGIALMIISVGFAFSIIDSFESDFEIMDRFSEVRHFVENYTRLLNNGQIEKAREFHSSQFNNDVNADQLDKLAEVLGKGDIVILQCSSTNFEKLPKGNQFYLSYAIQSQNETEQVAFLVFELDEKLAIDGIATQNSSGNSITIGPYTYLELQDSSAGIRDEKITSFFSEFYTILPIMILAGIFQTIVMWLVYDKADQPGWASIVPFYNMWVLAEIAEKPGWWVLIILFSGLIPYVGGIIGMVLSIIITVGVARTFGRGVAFGIGLIFLPLVFYPVLAFSKNRYPIYG